MTALLNAPAKVGAKGPASVRLGEGVWTRAGIGGWDVGLEGPQGGSLAATRAPMCVDVLVLCTYMALCTSGWS